MSSTFSSWFQGRQSSTSAAPLKLEEQQAQQVSGPLLVILVLLFSFGLIMLFSASMIGSLYTKGGSTTYFILRQLAFNLAGVLAIVVITQLNLLWFNKKIFVILSMGLSFLLLVIVLIPNIGILIQGARRWLPVPFTQTTFQPSEFTKIALVFYLAWYYSRLNRLRKAGKIVAADPKKQIWLDAWWDIIKPMIPVVAQCALISLQAHMSAVIIILTISLFLIATAGIRLRSWLVGLGVGATMLSLLAMVFLFISLIFPDAQVTQRWNHVITRINIFTADQSVNASVAWQSDQALVAIGSGGWQGLGLGQSRQKYMYLPENHNDYIFSIIGEELGFFGGLAVILLFVAFLICGLLVAKRAKSMYGRILAAGYTYLLTLQAFFSIGVNLGLLPPTGISLPFFSYGGTSNLFFMIGAGLLLSVSKFDQQAIRPELQEGRGV